MKWNVGDIVITAIAEQPLDDLADLIIDANPQTLADIEWLRPHFADDAGKLKGLVQSFVIEHDGQTIVVDTCVGDHKNLPVNDHWHQQSFGLYQKFIDAGFDPERVDIVLCTHMHLDHVGMNTILMDGNFVPSFPNARYLFAREEFEYWQAENDRPARDPDSADSAREKMQAVFHATQLNVHAESVQPIFDAGLADIVSAPCEVGAGIHLIPTPGHTPGHVSIGIESRGEKAFITGDCFHHPCQIAHADWATYVDVDRDIGSATRRNLLRDMAGSDTLFLGSHFAEPTAGFIVTDGTSYKLKIRSED